MTDPTPDPQPSAASSMESKPLDVKALFGLLLEAKEAARSGHSDAHRMGEVVQNALRDADPAVAQQAEQLIQAHERADTGLFIDTPDGSVSAETPAGDHGARVESPIIDGFRVGEEIGRGGFGVVYRGEQLVPVQRPVAIKILRTDLATPAMVARFRAEASVLARMNHEGIARVIDAGLDHANRPYVVMELIEGESLIKYCESHGLSIRDRVRLFEQICAAVQHAHQRAVIHRDLKPANVLVEDRGGDAVPRVIDFGIAKLVEDGGIDSQTLDGHRMGTPRYMSPEQRSGDGGADTRIDVFSLGVMLCEALTGEVPYAQTSSRNTYQSPSRPSTLVAAKSPERSALVRELKGDLDRIVFKAISPDPELRYQSANAMGDDLRRYLDGRPVLARDAGFGYKAIKFMNRHRFSSSLSALTMLALIVGGVGLGVGMNRATVSRDAAEHALAESERQRHRAEFVNRFLLNDMLGSIDPNVNQGREITVREVFDTASAKLAGRDDLDVETQYTTLRLIGLNYGQIGAHNEAMSSLRRAAELAEQFHGGPSRDGIEIELDLYDIITSNGRSGSTELGKTLARDAEAVLDPTDRLYLRVRLRISESIDELARIVDDFERDPTSNRVDRLVALANLGHLYAYASMPNKLLETRRKSYELSLEIFGPDHSTTLGALATYAAYRVAKYRDHDTLDLLYRAYEPSRRMMGLEHPITLMNMRSYAFLLGRLDDPQQAIELLEENAQGYSNRFGESSITHTLTLSYLGRMHMVAGHPETALPILERVRDEQANQWSPGHKTNVNAHLDVAMCHLALGDGASAIVETNAAMEIAKPESLQMGQAFISLADANRLQGLSDEAIAYAQQARAIIESLKPESLLYFDEGHRLVEVFDHLGDHQQATALQAALDEVQAGWLTATDD